MPKPDPIPAVLDAYGIRDENVTHGPPPNLLTPDEIRRIRAALDRMEAPPMTEKQIREAAGELSQERWLPYAIGVAILAILAILAGLWWALR